MQSMISLFLSQSYRDAWEDYLRSLHKTNHVRWDYVILTASNEQQAEGFRNQVLQRQRAGLLPADTHFAVVPDPDGKRVGSGGATLNVLRYIVSREGISGLRGKRTLVIHSGGDSKRVPQYSALGKLFSPVPHELPDGRASTLFDELIIALSGLPARIQSGMVLLSGDVLLLFNPLHVDFSGRDAAAISFKEHVETGKNHGVYLMGEYGTVAEFLHKQNVDTLSAKGAVNENGEVDIDTGAVIFSEEIQKALYSLISRDGCFSPEKFDLFVNERARLSLYGDFLYPLAERSTLEQFYLEKPEGEFCKELTQAREAVWKALRSFRMKLFRLSPAKFLHFGTTGEIMRLMHGGVADYAHLGWNAQVASSVCSAGAAAYNSVLSEKAVCGANVYLESSYVHSKGVIGSNVILSYVDIHDEVIPDNVVVHGLKQKNGNFVVRIFGIEDQPKADGNFDFLGSTIGEFMQKNGVSSQELWGDAPQSLWNARLYPECPDIRSAIAAALNVYALVQGTGDIEAWRGANRRSLCEGFHQACSDSLIAWENRMRELVRMNDLAEGIAAAETVEQVKQAFGARALSSIQLRWLQSRLSRAGFSERIRLHYYLGRILDPAQGEEHMERCFASIREAILENTQVQNRENQNRRICKEEYNVRLPLRVNWGGGWSDTPPYCLEHGGTVLNAAIKLGGELPVQVKVSRIGESKVVLTSSDMGLRSEFDRIEPLQHGGDPYDPYALHKAALLVSGVIPVSGGDLQTILDRLGGGFCLDTKVCAVPQGSGLGTSSILAAGCIKALFGFFGEELTDNDVYQRVLCMEQIMTTGGGWQDQVGGLQPGIKFITSRPGLEQTPVVCSLDIAQETLDELNERFALIYTGQRRLARHLLRDVVGRYIGNIPEVLEAFEAIRRTAALMRYELERGNVDCFARLLSEHWELSCTIDSGSTNTCIDQIFHSIEDMIDGKMICGAGGGGFLQVILKKGVSRRELDNRLKSVFGASGITVWECSLV